MRWLHAALGPAVEQACGIRPQLYPAEPQYKDAYWLQQIYRSFGRSVSHRWPDRSWLAIYDTHLDSLQVSEVFKSSLIIGFELPTVLKRLFDRRNIPYIELIFHPLRFADDLAFGFMSNIPDVMDKAAELTTPDGYFKSVAALHKANAIRRYSETFFTGDHAGLIAGQMDIDRSLLQDGALKSLEDYEEQIAALFAAHDEVFYKPHPHMVSKPEKQGRLYKVMRYLQRFGEVRFTTQNIYWLMGQPPLKAVYAISSGVTAEAPYFDVKGKSFMPFPFPFASQVHEGRYLTVMQQIYDAHFWSRALGGIMQTVSVANMQLPFMPNRTRKSVMQSWGYAVIDQGIDEKLLQLEQQASKQTQLLFNPLVKHIGMLKAEDETPDKAVFLAYEELLGRGPTAKELDLWRSRLSGGYALAFLRYSLKRQKYGPFYTGDAEDFGPINLDTLAGLDGEVFALRAFEMVYWRKPEDGNEGAANEKEVLLNIFACINENKASLLAHLLMTEEAGFYLTKYQRQAMSMRAEAVFEEDQIEPSIVRQCEQREQAAG